MKNLKKKVTTILIVQITMLALWNPVSMGSARTSQTGTAATTLVPVSPASQAEDAE